MDTTDRLERARQLAAESVDQFQAAHEAGMAALERHDYATLDAAISDESAAIEKHAAAVDQHRQALRELTTDDGSTTAPLGQ